MQLAISLPTDTKLPVYKQVSDALREAILCGRLKPGDKLPSTRELADSLNVSRFTVIRSYEELVSQGYIQTSSGSGTFVNPNLALELLVEQKYRSQKNRTEEPGTVRLSDYGNRVLNSPDIESAYVELFAELNYGAPTFDQLPLNAWRKALYKSSRFEDGEELIYENDPFGYAPLREAIASYLARSRSVSCNPDQVVIFSGAQAAMDLIGRLLLNRGDLVALENPGFPGTRRSFLMHGSALLPLPVDNEGLVVDDLEYFNEGIRLVCVTPSHQAPTGAVMSSARRLQLLKWAQRTGAFILEDDHDNEFRYAGKPVQAIQGLDQGDNVIYLGSFWKILYPVLRLSYMVLPNRLVPVVARAKSLIERDFPLLEQRALTEFINEGHLERHIKRTRDVYATRRVALIHALTKCFGKRVTISESVGGTDLLVKFDVPLDEEVLIKLANQAKVSLVSTNQNYLEEPTANEFIMGFAHLDAEHIQNTIGEFAALAEAARPQTVTKQ
jgi:GntR family transcriptional regulator / MocR family aminotransferase